MGKYSNWGPTELYCLLDNPIAEIHSLLEVDAMYLNSAITNFEIAVEQKAQTDSALQDLKKQDDIKYLEAYDWGDEIDIFNGDDIPEFTDAIELLEEGYSGYLQSLATVHIFCALCLEAHINHHAKELLSGKIRDEFDRFSIEAKWLTLPMLLGNGSYDVGSEPFQGFSRLIKIRNVLVHFKPSSEKWQRSIQPGEKPSFGLSLEEAQGSLDATKGMLARFSEIMKIKEPLWLSKENKRFFKIAATKKDGQELK